MRRESETVERQIQTTRDLLDYLLNYKLDSNTLDNSEVAIKVVCEVVDGFKPEKEATGYKLLSVTNKDKTLLHLVMQSANKWYQYTVWTWSKTEKIERGIEAKIHDSGTEDLLAWVSTTSQEYKEKYLGFKGYPDDLRDYLITESLTGYAISKKKVTDQCEFLASNGDIRKVTLSKQSDGSIAKEMKDIWNFINQTIATKRLEIRTMVSNFSQKLDCEELNLMVQHNCIKMGTIYLGKIVKVLQNNNTRTYQIRVFLFTGQDEITQNTIVTKIKAGVTGDAVNLNNLSDLWIAETRPNSYDTNETDQFARLPYNFVDEGRIILGIPRVNGSMDLIVGPDPRVDKEPVQHIKNVLEKYVDVLTKNLIKFTGTKIRNTKVRMDYDSFESAAVKNSADVKPLQIRLKALKMMVDEYKYIIQKKKAVGTDVSVSDKVKYNHTEGKVSYNDFSIAINDEMVKQRLFQTFESYLVSYYRGETTEETILNDILDKIFKELSIRINSYSSEDTTIPISINGCITVSLEIKTNKNKAKLIYLNGQRFNRNEVITALREITCYRSQEEANRFITNIGKVGLSVYIGITTGYETELGGSKKLFRFKKLKGRSNYNLMLDTIDIPLKGKELINLLYSKFIGNPAPSYEDKVQKSVFESVESTTDYVKYRFLIDSAYESFKERSEAFLKKKVADVGGEFVKYWNAKGKRRMSAITLVGMSGHRYVIAYDNKDSYVFMDSELKKDEKNTYENGKYVCMIDQSNIKSNIGFDTVISKLLALKNDSVIASTIYNLEEELSE